MPTPRSLRLTLAPIATSTNTTTPFQPSLLRKHTTLCSPLTPHLKSPAFRLPSTTTLSHSLSPTTPTSNSSSRPASPLAWTWRCHLCHTNYRLGTTRRCLLDGHYFCSQLPSPSLSPTVLPSSPEEKRLVPPPRLAERKVYCESEATEENAVVVAAAATRRESVGNKSGRRVKARKPAAACTTAFDYLAWADWNAWRREVSGSIVRPITGAARIPGLVSKSEVLKTGKDCFVDCDFPSECQWRCSEAYLEAVREEQEEEEEGEEEELWLI